MQLRRKINGMPTAIRSRWSLQNCAFVGGILVLYRKMHNCVMWCMSHLHRRKIGCILVIMETFFFWIFTQILIEKHLYCICTTNHLINFNYKSRQIKWFEIIKWILLGNWAHSNVRYLRVQTTRTKVLFQKWEYRLRKEINVISSRWSI